MSHELPPELMKRVHAHSHYRDVDYERLSAHYGPELITRRLERQMDLYDRAARRSRNPLTAWVKPCYRTVIRTGLFCCGQLARARKNARTPELVEREVRLPRLPAAFDGYRILQLTDFHFDYTPELADILLEKVKGLSFDLCVLTGDYRGEEYGPYEESLRELERLRPALGDKVYAILGNHDSIEIMLRFPEMDIHGLVNEAVWLERGGARLLLAGIDDPHWYRTCDFEPLRPQMREASCAVLLAHSPEIHREAAAEGFDFMLSGHTHGGQLCLPGGFPLIAHVHDTPRAMIRGPWQVGNLQGYTSRGAGTSSVDVRLNCRGEITLHTLRTD